ncbi:hypothetical protein N9A93_01695, partial [Akkermansiaceae bacterium]|nr:hypothetical protein [Akkermansiaceae bacterium]
MPNNKNLLARALARLLNSGNQRVEGVLPSQLPDSFMLQLVHELDVQYGTEKAEIPYAIWIRRKGPGNHALEKRHVKRSGEVVSFRNNHSRILIYREGDYEPIAGVLGSVRGIIPSGFPLTESGQVTLERLVSEVLLILAESEKLWMQYLPALKSELTAIYRKWADVFEKLIGQELQWNDAWWLYVINSIDRLSDIDPAELQTKGATWAACNAGSYPLPVRQNTVKDSKWKRLLEVVSSVFSGSEVAIDTVDRYETAQRKSHPVSSLDLKKLDELIPRGTGGNTGNQGLVLATLEGRNKDGECWGIVDEDELGKLLEIINEKGGQAHLFQETDGKRTKLPLNGIKSPKPVHLLPIGEWDWEQSKGQVEYAIDDLVIVLPWIKDGVTAAAIPNFQSGSYETSIASSPKTGLNAVVMLETPSKDGLEIKVSLDIAFKLGKRWKTGPYKLTVKVPLSHPGSPNLGQVYELRLVISVPWGITAVCSSAPPKPSCDATGDSVFSLSEDGIFHCQEVGSVTVNKQSAPVVSDLLIYDASYSPENWPDKCCPSFLYKNFEPVEEWIGCWKGVDLELPEGACVVQPDSGETILSVNVEEQDNRPFLPLLATIDHTTPSDLTIGIEDFGEHALIARMDQLLAKELLSSRDDDPFGLAQVVVISGDLSLANSLVQKGNILWPFEQTDIDLKLRHIGSGPSSSFLETPEVESFRKSLKDLCREVSKLPGFGQPLMLARKQLKDLSSEIVTSYLNTYAKMVEAARESHSSGDFFWATHPCSVILGSGSGSEHEVGATLLSPFHPVRLGWLYSCEQVFADLAEGSKDMAQVTEGWNFPAVAPAPARKGASEPSMMAVPMDPGYHQIFLGWSLMADCCTGNEGPLEVPFCEYGGMHIPGGATSGISSGGIHTALRDYLTSYPYLGSLVLELTSRNGGQRSSSLDHAIIEEVAGISATKHQVNSVRIIDDPRRRGTPPNYESTIALAIDQNTGRGNGVERFEWTRSNSSLEDFKKDISFVEDAAAEFSVSSGDNSSTGVGVIPDFALRRFSSRIQNEDSHSICYDLIKPANDASDFQKAFFNAIKFTERTRGDASRSISVYATLDNLVGSIAADADWIVIGNVGLDVATLSKLSAADNRLLWEWRPPFIDTSGMKENKSLDLSRRSFTCLSSV